MISPDLIRRVRSSKGKKGAGQLSALPLFAIEGFENLTFYR